MSNKGFAPVAMAEEYWANSHMSIARYYGRIQFNSHEYQIVNKHGITIFELSDPSSKHYVGGGNKKAIEPGEPADLVRRDFITYYRRLGRERFLEVLKEHQQASDTELKKIFKALTKKKK